MIYVQQFIRDILLSVDTITDIVGARVYAKILPQGCTLPAMTVSQVSPERTYTQAEQCNLVETDVTLTGYADLQIEVLELMEQVRLLLSGYAGTLGSYTVGAVFIESETEDYADEVHSLAFALKISNFEKTPGVVNLNLVQTVLLASGGASAPTHAALSIGAPNGPQTAAMYGWLALKDGTGATVWVPVWK